MEFSNEKIKHELAKYLEKYGVKQNHISELTGLSDTTISLFLKGQRELSLSKLEKISSILERNEQTN
jgi:transcriptional regulator with XRE-family HTH domain